jgi:tRNA(fMet)-specific endonuclease VapC
MESSLYLLDTDACIDMLRLSPEQIPPKIGHLKQENLLLSSIVLAELETGVRKSARPEIHARRLSFLVKHLTVAAFDANAARVYGEIRTHLERKGRSIGPLDLLVAAHACSLSAILVTRNLREFKRVPKLQCLSWREAKEG